MVTGRYMRKRPPKPIGPSPRPDPYDGWVIVTDGRVITIFQSMVSVEFCNSTRGTNYKYVRDATREEIDGFYAYHTGEIRKQMASYDALPPKVRDQKK
jgi:hypothetical protein